MQTDEITSLKARIVRLEEVNELLVKALENTWMDSPNFLET